MPSAKQCLWGSHVTVTPYVTKSLQLAPSKGWDYTQRNYLGYFWILPPLHQTFCSSFLNHPWACPFPSLFLSAVFGSLPQRCSPSITAILLLSPLLPVSVSCSVDYSLTFSVVFFFALRCDSPPWTRMCTSFVVEPTLGIFTQHVLALKCPLCRVCLDSISCNWSCTISKLLPVFYHILECLNPVMMN